MDQPLLSQIQMSQFHLLMFVLSTKFIVMEFAKNHKTAVKATNLYAQIPLLALIPTNNAVVRQRNTVLILTLALILCHVIQSVRTHITSALRPRNVN